MSHPLPYVQYDPNGNGSGIPFQHIEPGVESDNFQLNNPVTDNAATSAICLNGFNQFVIKSIPPSFGDVSWVGGTAVVGDIATYDVTTGLVIQDSGILAVGPGTLSGNNTGNVTLAAVDSSGIPNPDSASLSGATGQVLNLNSASVAFPGVVNTVAQSFLGVKFFTSGIQLNTAFSAGDTVVLDIYEESEPNPQSQTWTGAFATNQTAFWGWSRIGFRGFVDIAAVTGAAAASGSLITATVALPTFMWPVVPRICPIPVDNGGTIVQGSFIVSPAGIITVGVGFPNGAGVFTSANNFGTTGNNGITSTQGFYLVDA